MHLQGKTAAFLGDSITEGVGVTDRDANRYDNIVRREMGLAKTYNFGIGGTRLAHQKNASENPRFDLCMCGRAYDLPEDADLIVVYGGINDYRRGDAPIGTAEDYGTATFSGAVNFIMTFLKENHPDAKIVFMTPARCNDGVFNYTQPSVFPQKCGNAVPLRTYVDIICEAGKRHGIPVLDLYKKLPIEPLDDAQKEKYTVDGLHFNDEGQKVLANTLIAFLRELDD